MKILTRPRGKDEAGVLLLSVVVISLFVFTVALLLAGTSLVAIQSDRTTKSNMQALEAAKTGRETVHTALRKGECTAAGSSNLSPGASGGLEWRNGMAYEWQVYRYRATGTEVPTTLTQSGVTAGCPASDTTHVLVRVEGKDSFNRKSTLVSTYGWARAAGTTTRFNSAVYSGSSMVLSGFNVLLPSGVNTPADLIMESGGFKCEGSGTKIQGNVYIPNGYVQQLDGCNTVTGNISATGYISVNANARAVDGSICTRSDIRNFNFRGSVGGAAMAYQATCPGLDIPGWVDYNPTLTSAGLPGWNLVTLSGSDYCNNNSNMGQPPVYRSEGHLAYYIKQLTSPTVIDMSACSEVRLLNLSLPLKTDVTIIGGRFTIQGVNLTAFSGSAERQFNIITPDKTATTPAARHCGSGQGQSTFQSNVFTAPVKGLFYTPCGVGQMTGTYRGQLYMGIIASNISNGSLTYIPVTLPGETPVTSGSTGSPSGASGRASEGLMAQSES